MKVTHFPKQITDKKTTLILGSFESFHLGHLELLKKANELHHKVVIMVIENVSAIPGSSKEEYASLDIRLQNLANLKIDYAIVVKFTPDLRVMEGKDFINKIMKSCNAENLVMGKDFKCGKGGEYKASDIAKDHKNTYIVEPLKAKDTKISTSILKEMVTLGDVDVIRKVAPFPYSIITHVSADGFFKFNNEVKPHNGVYAVMVDINSIRYWGVAHIALSGKHHLYVPDFQVKNTPVDAQINFHKMLKIIINSKADVVTEADKEQAALYLKNAI